MKELEARLEPHGFPVAYDGMKVPSHDELITISSTARLLQGRVVASIAQADIYPQRKIIMLIQHQTSKEAQNVSIRKSGDW